MTDPPMTNETKMHDEPLKKRKGEKRLVVIDGNHLIHRAYHAIQAPLKTSSGEQTNAIFGFASMLLNIIELEQPDYLAMTFDERAPTFRHEAHEGYKATRVKAPDELYAQIPRIKEMIGAFKIPVYSKEGFEADDMMGTLAHKAIKDGLSVYIVTGDRDLLQLVDHTIHVVFPHKGYREPTVYDSKAVLEKFGIHPNQMVDYKALVGDPSDNIDGVQGIGPKGAAELLSKYKTLDGIYEHLGELTESVRNKLTKGKEAAYFAQSLSKIVTDVPCDFKKEDTSTQKLDFLGLQRFFEQMEMKSLQGRLRKMMPAETLTDKKQLSLF
jgi:DNA polymerase I